MEKFIGGYGIENLFQEIIMLADALLIIDMQNAVCFSDGKIYQYDNLIRLINQRIDEYHSHNKPIIFIQHENDILIKDSEAWQIVDDLAKKKGTLFVGKQYPSAFYHTELKSLLDKQNIQSLEICGAETPFCVEATIQAAHCLGYKLLMKKGATSTNYHEYMSVENTIKHYEDIWRFGRFLTFLD